MQNQKESKLFYYIIADHQNKVFNLFGPTTYNTQLIDAVCDQQKTGRDIRCSIRSQELEKEGLIQSYAEEWGCEYVTDQILTPKYFRLNSINGM